MAWMTGILFMDGEEAFVFATASRMTHSMGRPTVCSSQDGKVTRT
jgi:hypothetical protein